MKIHSLPTSSKRFAESVLIILVGFCYLVIFFLLAIFPKIKFLKLRFLMAEEEFEK